MWKATDEKILIIRKRRRKTAQPRQQREKLYNKVETKYMIYGFGVSLVERSENAVINLVLWKLSQSFTCDTAKNASENFTSTGGGKKASTTRIEKETYFFFQFLLTMCQVGGKWEVERVKANESSLKSKRWHETSSEGKRNSAIQLDIKFFFHPCLWFKFAAWER